MLQPSIVLLIPYFGKWPAWFDLFLLTCKFNPSIEWLFYTDCGAPKDIPSNVTFKEISFAEYKIKVSKELKINFNPDSAYKLCDIKPALGFIHHEDIKGFDFWGFSDIDLIYGDLRKFYTKEKLAKYDLLSTHSRRVSGHFSLMRNNKKMREAFSLIKDWQTRYADSRHFALDEGAFSRIFIRHKNLPHLLFKYLNKLNSWHRKSEFVELYTTPNAGLAWVDGSYNFPKKWYWNAGILTNCLTQEVEYPYFHFFGWKKDVWKKSDFETISSDKLLAFTVSKSGFSLREV